MNIYYVETSSMVNETSTLVNEQLDKLVTLVNGTSVLVNGQLEKLVSWLMGLLPRLLRLVPWLMSN